jgi:hypothetical protein
MSETLSEPRDLVLAALRVFHEPGDVVELRVPGHPRANATTSGYFDDFEQLADEIDGLDGQAPGLYITLNRVNPAVLARSPNRITEWAKTTTSDTDVTRRRWLLVDLDPVRPAGVSSTDAEHQAAVECAGAVADWLVEQGWPEPVGVNSGNGAHLLYRVDLPADDGGLVRRCLEALAARFDAAAAKVDQTVHNPARIVKLPGTLACKGYATDDRPHRRSRLLHVPDPVVTADVQLLEALAARVEGPKPGATHEANGHTGNGHAGGSRLDVARWLTDRGVAYRVKEGDARDPRVKFRIVCPFDPGHTDAAVMQAPDGKLSAKCFHDSCAGRGWAAFKEAIGAPDPEHFVGGGGDGDEVPIVRIVSIAPPKLEEAAYLGLAGRFLKAVAPYTEATDAGVLAHLLTAVGVLVGPHVYAWGGGKQPARLNAAVVGPTNAGRKGTSFAPVDLLMQRVALAFWAAQRVNGLTSGEGLIAYVADREEEDDDGHRKPVPVEKRLYVVEEEFSRVLVSMHREGSVLSQVVRSAYDHGNLATLTVKPRVANGAHVAVVGHITPEELALRLTSVDAANGFGNRFLWFLVRSDKIMPFAKPIPDEVFQPFVEPLGALVRLGSVLNADHAVGMDASASGLWAKVYGERLRRDRPGLAGAMLARGAPMVLRLALTYALLECPRVKGALGSLLALKNWLIRAEHLEAALAVWAYCEESARQLFGNRSGDPLGDKLLALLAAGPMKRGDLNRHLSNNQKADAGLALAKLEAAGLVRRRKVSPTGTGRPSEVWELAVGAGGAGEKAEGGRPAGEKAEGAPKTN